MIGEMKMHYAPPASAGGTGSGRVVSHCFNDVFLTDFLVAPDNSVTVPNDHILIASVTGSALTESAPPEPFAGRDGYECLGRPPVEVPVLFIPRPDEVQIYGKGRIPGRHVGRLGDAGHLRGQGGVGAEMRQLDNACQLEETALDSQLVPARPHAI